jgi:hypothetical protein
MVLNAYTPAPASCAQYVIEAKPCFGIVEAHQGIVEKGSIII